MVKRSLLQMLGLLFLSGLAGCVRYFGTLNGDPSKFNWHAMIMEMIMSGFIGIIIILISQELGFSTAMTGAFVGVGSHEGIRLIYLLRNFIAKEFAGKDWLQIICCLIDYLKHRRDKNGECD